MLLQDEKTKRYRQGASSHVTRDQHSRNGQIEEILQKRFETAAFEGAKTILERALKLHLD